VDRLKYSQIHPVSHTIPTNNVIRCYSTTNPTFKKKTEKEEVLPPEVLEQIENYDKDEWLFSEGLTLEEAKRIFEEKVAIHEAQEEAKLYKNWVPGTRKRPLQYSYNEDDFLEDAHLKWTLRHKRCGALGIKVGMMPVWDEWGERHSCTILYLDENVVLEVKNKDQHGYDAVVLGAGERKLKRVNKPLRGIYDKHGLARPPAIVGEFRIGGPENVNVAPEPGSFIHARHFVPGQNVDVSGICKGKGFQGAMKRHNFKGMPASHGVSKSHRALGSTGQCQDPGRVFKGKKMAGRMGGNRVTVQNLRVLKIDRGRNLLYLKGCVPGNKGQFVEIRDAVKQPLWGTNYIEGGVECKKPPLPTFEYEEGIDGSGQPGFDTFMPSPSTDPLVPKEIEAIP